MKRVPLYPPSPSERSQYNNGGLHEYDPYMIIDGKNVIDPNWWDSLTPDTKKLITHRLDNNFTWEKITIPHVIQKDNDSNFLTVVHVLYKDSYDYNVWYDENIPEYPQGVKQIEITQDMKPEMAQSYKLDWETIDRSSPIRELKSQLDEFLQQNPGEYFIKLSSTSGKCQKSVEPFSQTKDIIKHITSTKIIRDQEYKRLDKPSFLIMIPWNDNITKKYEFRMFIVNRKITAISQQFWDQLYQYSTEELDIIEEVLLGVQFIKHMPYNDCVADVHVDIENKRCNLIELNPFGAHSGAGSALFNWITDYDLLQGLKLEPEFRYLSIINY